MPCLPRHLSGVACRPPYRHSKVLDARGNHDAGEAEFLLMKTFLNEQECDFLRAQAGAPRPSATPPSLAFNHERGVPPPLAFAAMTRDCPPP